MDHCPMSCNGLQWHLPLGIAENSRTGGSVIEELEGESSRTLDESSRFQVGDRGSGAPKIGRRRGVCIFGTLSDYL